MAPKTVSKENTATAPVAVLAMADQKSARDERFKNRQMKTAESEANDLNENNRSRGRRRAATRRENRAENVEPEPVVDVQVAVVPEPAVVPSPIPPVATAAPAASSVSIVEPEPIPAPLQTHSSVPAQEPVVPEPAVLPPSVSVTNEAPPRTTAAPISSSTHSAENANPSRTPFQLPTVNNSNENKRNGGRRRAATRRENIAENVENVETGPVVDVQVAVVPEPAVVPSPIPPPSPPVSEPSTATAAPTSSSVSTVDLEPIAAPLEPASSVPAQESVVPKPAVLLQESVESEASNSNENKRNGERRRAPTRRENSVEDVENVETQPVVAVQVADVPEPAVVPSPIPPTDTAAPAASPVSIVEAETIAAPFQYLSFAPAQEPVVAEPAILPSSVPVTNEAPPGTNVARFYWPISSTDYAEPSTSTSQLPPFSYLIANDLDYSTASSLSVSQEPSVDYSCACPEHLQRIAELEKQLDMMTRRSELLEADNYQLRQDLRRATKSRKRPAEEEVPEAPVAKRNPLFRDVSTKRKLPADIKDETVVTVIEQKQLEVERVRGTITDCPEIYFNDMKCFKEGEFINDTIVDFGLFEIAYQNWPRELFQKTHIFNGLFYASLMKNATPQNISEAIQGNMERMVKYQNNVFEKEILVVPACIEKHWVLAIVLQPENLLIPGKTCTVVVFNSMGTESRNTYLAIVIQEYLRAMFEKTKGFGGKFFNFNHKKFYDHQIKLVVMKGQPIQKNHCDCGFFLMQNFCDFFSRHRLFSATYEELKEMNWAEVAPNAQMEASQRRKRMLKRILDEYEEADQNRLGYTRN